MVSSDYVQVPVKTSFHWEKPTDDGRDGIYVQSHPEPGLFCPASGRFVDQIQPWELLKMNEFTDLTKMWKNGQEFGNRICKS